MSRGATIGRLAASTVGGVEVPRKSYGCLVNRGLLATVNRL